MRTRRTQDATAAEGIHTHGVRAYTSLKANVTADALRDRIDSVVNSHQRFSRTKTVADGVNVYVRANIWTWGEVIELRFTPVDQATSVTATCSPRLKTTLIDYGQAGKDLALFMGLLTQEIGSGVPRHD
ncbi:hypothetical protein M1D88_13145 [Arthrobacter sp. R1-13]